MLARLDQTYFLLGLGITELEGLSLQQRLALKTLLLPGGLGSTHKVLIFGKDVGTADAEGSVVPGSADVDALAMAAHGWLGLVILAVSEAAMLAHVEPFWTWHTPFAWTGYILLVDGIISRKRGSSWLTTNRREFLFLALVSIPLWLVFEGYNLLIKNWHYINLPAESAGVRYFGYAWAFATISPGIFQTAELVAILRGLAVCPPRQSGVDPTTKRLVSVELSTFDYVSLVIGMAHARCCRSSGRRRIWRRRSFSASSFCSIRSMRCVRRRISACAIIRARHRTSG